MIRFGVFFRPHTRFECCGCWRARDQRGPRRIVCHRLATPWVTATDGLHPDNLETPGHPLDLFGTRLTFQLARVGARYAPVASHICPPDLPPETTSYSPHG
eukprot:944897-Pyramimonas_sp.AAC.1